MEKGKLCLVCDIINTEEAVKCLNCGNANFKILTKEEILNFNYKGEKVEKTPKTDSSQ